MGNATDQSSDAGVRTPDQTSGLEPEASSVKAALIRRPWLVVSLYMFLFLAGVLAIPFLLIRELWPTLAIAAVLALGGGSMVVLQLHRNRVSAASIAGLVGGALVLSLVTKLLVYGRIWP